MSFPRVLAITLLCSLYLPGCLPAGHPVRPITFYTLQYSSPAPNGTPVDGVVKIDRFSAVRSYDGSAMIFRPDPYRVVAYNYHKWRTTPGDMVSEHLLQDFQNCGLFRTVFSWRQPETARFVVEGMIEEFAEAKEHAQWEADLDVRVTLLDRGEHGNTEEVVFQNRYRVVKSVTDGSPEAFAAGMSAAMAQASEEIIIDVSGAIRGAGPEESR